MPRRLDDEVLVELGLDVERRAPPAAPARGVLGRNRQKLAGLRHDHAAIGMGLRQLSVTPHNSPEIKKIIRSVTLDEAKAVAQEVLTLESARDVNNYLREKTRRILPEVVS